MASTLRRTNLEPSLKLPERTFSVGAVIGCALIFVLIFFAGIGAGIQLTLTTATLIQPIIERRYGAVFMPQAQVVVANINAPATVMPQPTTLPTATISETLAGARDALRLGKADAPIQMVIFADPQCPFCKQLALETEPQLIAAYVNTGQAALSYRHFAFLGPESERIAIAMECAGEHGKFFGFYRYAFEHQQPENGGLATDALMLDWAKATQLDLDPFKNCTQNPAIRERVQADVATGRKLGVVGTPTLFINGRPMPGALPFEFLKTAIEAELKR